MKKYTKTQQGSIIPTIIIFLVAFMAIGTVTLGLISSNYSIAIQEDLTLHAQMAADAGADMSVQKINADPTWIGTAGEQVVYDSPKIRTTYESSVVTNGGIVEKDPKTITIVGKTYSPSGSTNPRATRKIAVDVRGVGGGSYAIVTGVGGLIMSNSSKVTGGDVYVNGGITMSNTAQIGSTTKAVNVRVANARCPINVYASDYPRKCTSGENNNPIKMTNSAVIYGTVRANYQTNFSGISNPIPTTDSIPLADLPEHDRQAQKSAVTTTRNGSSSDAGCSSNGATRNWAANTKIVGNVNISHKCVITVYGDIWITGNLTFNQSSVIKVAEGVTTPPVIMIDGPGGLDSNNSSILMSNSASKGFRVITYWSAASCSPDCTSVTGGDYQNSKNVTTISLGNSAAGPNTEFYARWSQVDIGNSGDIGAVAGQTVNLNNSAAITFGTEVTGLGTPSAWIVKSYRRMY